LKKNLIFRVSKVNKPTEEDILVNVNNLDVNWNRVGIEVIVKDSKTKRADIIIPFNKYDSNFGFGIVIEIQFSKQREETTEKRNVEWAIKGFSVCWLFEKDFLKISDEIIELADEKLKLNIVGKILEEQKEKNYNEIRDIIQLFSRQIDEKMKELNYPFYIGYCNKCNHGYMTKRKTKSGKEIYGCSNYPNCKHSIWIN